jgi:hypothetical protein
MGARVCRCANRATESAYLAVEPNPWQALARWLLAGARELNTVRAFERLRPKPLAAYGPAAAGRSRRAAARRDRLPAPRRDARGRAAC